MASTDLQIFILHIAAEIPLYHISVMRIGERTQNFDFSTGTSRIFDLILTICPNKLSMLRENKPLGYDCSRSNLQFLVSPSAASLLASAKLCRKA